jgi:hypothetical protein
VCAAGEQRQGLADAARRDAEAQRQCDREHDDGGRQVGAPIQGGAPTTTTTTTDATTGAPVSTGGVDPKRGRDNRRAA